MPFQFVTLSEPCPLACRLRFLFNVVLRTDFFPPVQIRQGCGVDYTILGDDDVDAIDVDIPINVRTLKDRHYCCSDGGDHVWLIINVSIAGQDIETTLIGSKCLMVQRICRKKKHSFFSFSKEVCTCKDVEMSVHDAPDASNADCVLKFKFSEDRSRIVGIGGLRELTQYARPILLKKERNVLEVVKRSETKVRQSAERERS